MSNLAGNVNLTTGTNQLQRPLNFGTLNAELKELEKSNITSDEMERCKIQIMKNCETDESGKDSFKSETKLFFW